MEVLDHHQVLRFYPPATHQSGTSMTWCHLCHLLIKTSALQVCHHLLYLQATASFLFKHERCCSCLQSFHCSAYTGRDLLTCTSGSALLTPYGWIYRPGSGETFYTLQPGRVGVLYFLPLFISPPICHGGNIGITEYQQHSEIFAPSTALYTCH